MPPTYRVARVDDIPVLMEIRNGVTENALVHTVLTAEDYAQAMTVDGRAWLCESEGQIVGFSCGRTTPGDIWALFVRESHEGQGIGRALMARVEAWMFEQGLDALWLVTGPGTRAERLYRRRGWVERGKTAAGELKFVLSRDASADDPPGERRDS